jgi:nucleoside triphosphatase
MFTQRGNIGKLREIDRKIASAVIISEDGKILMGRKDPDKGGVFPDAWHIPGGGIEEGETVDQAVIREIAQEVVGLDLSKFTLKLLPFVGRGSSAKTLPSGERVWVNMEFNRLEVRLDKPAQELEQELSPGDDLVKLQWFSRSDLENAELIPGGHGFFVEAGYLDD